MRVIARAGREDIATVYLAENSEGKVVEFVESVQPPIPREKKWVLIVSSLYGCPVGCRFCDAGSYYQGILSKEEIIFQMDYLIKQRFGDISVPVKKFKVQFARMGEPAFNQNVLEILESLPQLYNAPGLMPSFSTIAPYGKDKFFEKLLEIKKRHYSGRFQFQFSIHTTDEKLRDWLIPVRKWDFKKMAEYGEAFFEKGGRKITLNFALADNFPVDPHILLSYFNPDVFLIKITPVNPTHQASRHKLYSTLTGQTDCERIKALQKAGYVVILSIGELEENHIGSNCGQFVTAHRNSHKTIEGGYTYELRKL
ncbi:MAG: radical SAM protein [candidate division Zixibacteria bacterium]|nr:radical SAM protein [candidate division Zixibacteria bacterium]